MAAERGAILVVLLDTVRCPVLLAFALSGLCRYVAILMHLFSFSLFLLIHTFTHFDNKLRLPPFSSNSSRRLMEDAAGRGAFLCDCQLSLTPHCFGNFQAADVINRENGNENTDDKNQNHLAVKQRRFQ